MSSYPTSGQAPRPTSTVGPSSSGPASDAISDHNGSEQGGLSEAVSQLGRDIASLKDSFAQLASQAGGEAAKSMRTMSQAVASQVGDAAGGAADKGADLAAAAREQVKTFASELEAMARRNPLGTIAGTLVVGIVIGLMSRGRG
jgi:ElaB/YqjD/DUF883 family membrane-anchored ribosome-binding protein